MRFFSYDNPVWRVVMKAGQIWWLNILWVLTSLPVITIGASTTALIYSCRKLQKEEGYPTANFFHSFRDNFLQSTLIWILYAATGALLLWGLVFYNQTDYSEMKLLWAVDIALLIPWGLSFLYVFGVQSRFVNPVTKTIRYSLILSIRHFRYTFQMVLMAAVLIYVNTTTVVLVNFLTLFFGAGLMAYLFSLYYEKVFERYIPAEQPEEDVPEDHSGESQGSGAQ